MTIARYILLTAIAFSPLTATAQVFTPSQPGLVEGAGSRFPARSQLGAITDTGVPGGTMPDALSEAEVLLMQGAVAAPGPQTQPETISLPQVPPALMPPAGRYNTSPIWQTSISGGYFGIMGAIAQPGVYFHREQRITLGELLKLSGGPTSTASGGVRIVRQGRGGLQTFLSPESKHEIMNGDVVLLEGQRPQGKSGLRDYPKGAAIGDAQPSSSAAAGPKLPPLAHIAFVNLLPQPIVVPVPSDQATLAAVIKWLHQDGESPPFVRVVAPSPLLRQTSSRPVEQQLLESGSVLVFDPATIKRDRLPPFPPVIGLPAPSDTAPIQVPPRDGRVLPPAAGTPAKNIPLPPRQPGTDQPAKAFRAPPPPPEEPDQRSAELPPFGTGGRILAPAENFHESPVQGGPQSGGPLLMMPQSNRPSRSQATAPDSHPRRPVPPKRLDNHRDEEATPAHYEGQTMSWQSRPPVRANEGLPEVEDLGVIQAHGEQGRVDHEFAGPALELPHPVPNLVDPEPLATVQPAPAQAAPAPLKIATSTFSMQIVWFSLGSMLLLAVILWGVARWDGPRPVRAAVTAGHASRFRGPAPQPHGAIPPPPAPLALKRTEPTTTHVAAEAPLPIKPVAPAVPEPVRAKPSTPAPSPGQARTISQEEQRLRAHFRDARQTRVAATPAPVEPAPLPTPPAAKPALSLSRDELRLLSGRSSVPAQKILAQIPSLKKTTPSAADHSPAAAGHLLDRILRAHQKR